MNNSKHIEIMHGNNVFRNIDIVTGFVANTNNVQCCDVFYIFTEKGYVKSELHHEIIKGAEQ